MLSIYRNVRWHSQLLSLANIFKGKNVSFKDFNSNLMLLEFFVLLNNVNLIFVYQLKSWLNNIFKLEIDAILTLTQLVDILTQLVDISTQPVDILTQLGKVLTQFVLSLL